MIRCFTLRWFIGLILGLAPLKSGAGESWPAALAQMPLGTRVPELNRTNCVTVILAAFQSNDLVKALVFMPGATDEFYMFRRAKAALTNDAPTLLDAVSALTNQTLIRVTFLPPMLVLHTDEDPLEPQNVVLHQPSADRLKATRFLGHFSYNDRDWDYLQPILAKRLKADVHPWLRSPDSWHFYRHSLAAWNLTAWEAIEAISIAGKTKFTIRYKSPINLRRTKITFEGDHRYRAIPKFDVFPR